MSRVGYHAKVNRTVQRAITRFVGAVRDAVEHTGVPAPGSHVLVALSGGADSTATLAALVFAARRLNLRLSACHVHHGLRGAEADADAATARALAARFDAPVYVENLSRTLREGGNTEERARQARYAALATRARAIQADCIATGHTRDDQAETVLLRMIRGCGPSGLVGILPVATIAGMTVARPLLNCSRREVEAFVEALGVSYCEDSSNRDRRFQRNRIRHDVLPLLRDMNPQIDRALANLAELMRQREASVSGSTVSSDGVLSIRELLRIPVAQRGETIRHWLAEVRGHRRGLTQRHVAAVLSLLRGPRPSRRVALPGGTVERVYDRLRFGRAESVAPAESLPRRIVAGHCVHLDGWDIEVSRVESVPHPRRLPSDLWNAVIAADAVPELLIRTPMSGDRIQPLGMRGRRKLGDIFVDRKIPHPLRSAWPVVQCGADVLWVPGVVRSSGRVVNEQTRRVLWLRAKTAAKPLLG